MLGWDEIEKFDDTGLDDRVELINHLDWLIRPPHYAVLIDQIVEAIELAAAGKTDEWIEVDLRRCQVSEVVDAWKLEELVERARAGEFAPRGGERSWICKPTPYWSPPESRAGG